MKLGGGMRCGSGKKPFNFGVDPDQGPINVVLELDPDHFIKPVSCKTYSYELLLNGNKNL